VIVCSLFDCWAGTHAVLNCPVLKKKADEMSMDHLCMPRPKASQSHRLFSCDFKRAPSSTILLYTASHVQEQKKGWFLITHSFILPGQRPRRLARARVPNLAKGRACVPNHSSGQGSNLAKGRGDWPGRVGLIIHPAATCAFAILSQSSSDKPSSNSHKCTPPMRTCSERIASNGHSASSRPATNHRLMRSLKIS